MLAEDGEDMTPEEALERCKRRGEEPELEEDEECWLEESECEQCKESITVGECRRRQRYKMDKFDTYEAVDEQQAQGKQILDSAWVIRGNQVEKSKPSTA